MFCIRCGTRLPENAGNCPNCGAVPFIPVSSPEIPPEAPTNVQPLAVPPQMPMQMPPMPANPAPAGYPAAAPGYGQNAAPPRKAKKKTGMIIAIVLVVVVAAAVAVPLVLRAAKQNRYDDAVSLMDSGDYSAAIEAFSKLSGFSDSDALAEYCQNALSYEDALALMDSGDYPAALEAFSLLEGFEAADSYAEECADYIMYEEANALQLSGDYGSALTLFETLGSFGDAAERAEFCNNSLIFEEAAAAMDEGLYYTAYTLFDSIGDFPDAAVQRDSCRFPFPDTGETFHNENYYSSACTLTVNTPSGDGSDNYLKIYSENGDLVSCLAIAPGESASVDLPSGVYQIKAAYSSGGWFGEQEMFGDDGWYQVLTYDDAGTDVFTFEYNYEYTLSLRGADGADSGDGVGTYTEDRGSF